MRRPPVAFLAWSSVEGRSREIADALGGEARCYYDLRIVRRAFVPLRYLVSAIRTIAYLLGRRPQALIVTNPPVFVALVAYPYARAVGAPFLLDSHPDAFRDDGPHARFRRIHAWLARRANGILVTTQELVLQVEEWGGVGVIVHEPPPLWEVAPATLPARPRVLVLGTLSTDEPVAAALEAARRLPDVDFELTGDTRKCTDELLSSAPANVTFLGFLHAPDYAAALQRSSVAVVLTNWVHWAVPRSAYDAVYALRPLVVTGSPVLRELFPHAVPVDNEAAAIAAGVSDAIDRHGDLVCLAPEALAEQTRRWEAQLDRLRSLIRPSSR